MDELLETALRSRGDWLAFMRVERVRLLMRELKRLGLTVGWPGRELGARAFTVVKGGDRFDVWLVDTRHERESRVTDGRRAQTVEQVVLETPEEARAFINRMKGE